MNQYTKIVTVVQKTYGKGRDKTDLPIEREEKFVKIYDLMDNEDLNAEVTRGVSTKVSDSARWGRGDWDKIPFSVEVFSSVKLIAKQDEETIETAQEIAHELALAAAKESMVQSVAEHIMTIKKDLFPKLFHD